MEASDFKTRLVRYARKFLIGLVAFVVTAPIGLTLFLSWEFESLITTQSQRDHQISLVWDSSWGDTMTVLYHRPDALRKVASFGEVTESHIPHSVRAFWSRDGALFVVQDQDDKAAPFLVFDCGQNTTYGTQRGKLLLKQHGGKGTLAFDGGQDFEAKAHRLWPWEIWWTMRTEENSVVHDA